MITGSKKRVSDMWIFYVYAFAIAVGLVIGTYMKHC